MTQKRATPEQINNLIGDSLVLGKIGAYVVQRTSPAYANFASEKRPRRQIREWVKTPHRNTPAQVRTKVNFADAVAMWVRLPQQQKDEYKRRARRFRNMTAIGLFISQNIRRNVV